MSKEQEIEAIARTMAHIESCERIHCNVCIYERCCPEYEQAKELVNAGYGNIKQAVKEFAGKIKYWLHGADLYFYNGQEKFILNNEGIDYHIDEIFKETYGND